MMYGDTPDKNLLEKSVRYIIILIIIVFDPLALLMYIAANMSFYQMEEEKKARVDSETAESKKKTLNRRLNNPYWQNLKQ